MGQRVDELAGDAVGRDRRRRRGHEGGQRGLPQRGEADSSDAFQGQQVAGQDNRQDDRYMRICRAHDAVLMHAQQHGRN